MCFENQGQYKISIGGGLSVAGPHTNLIAIIALFMIMIDFWYNLNK